MVDTEVGRLNRRITIQKQSDNDNFDSIGNQLDGWADYHSCWAAITGDKGNETQSAREPHEVRRKTFKVRYCKTLEEIRAEIYRIKYRGEYYDIESVDNLMEGDSLLLLHAAKEV